MVTDALSLDKVEELYPLPDSFIKLSLLTLAQSAQLRQTELTQDKRGDDAMAIDNALYLVLKKYIPQVSVSEDKSAYVSELLSAVSRAKFEFSQVCYDNTFADEVLSSFRLLLVAEMASLAPTDTSTSTCNTPQSVGKISRSAKLKGYLKIALCDPLAAFFFYLLPCIWFSLYVQSASFIAIPAYALAYFVHVFLMTNDPHDNKGIELIVLGLIQLMLFIGMIVLVV